MSTPCADRCMGVLESLASCCRGAASCRSSAERASLSISLSLSLSLYIYIYIYVIHMNIYIYIEREREMIMYLFIFIYRCLRALIGAVPCALSRDGPRAAPVLVRRRAGRARTCDAGRRHGDCR